MRGSGTAILIFLVAMFYGTYFWGHHKGAASRDDEIALLRQNNADVRATFAATAHDNPEAVQRLASLTDELIFTFSNTQVGEITWDEAKRKYITDELRYLAQEAKNGGIPTPLVHVELNTLARYLLIIEPRLGGQTGTDPAWDTINNLRIFLDGNPK